MLTNSGRSLLRFYDPLRPVRRGRMNSARLDEGRMRGMQDVAEFTSSLIEWAGDLLPDLTIRAVSARSALPQDKASESDAVLVRLASVEGSNGPRSGDAISRRLTLEYEFDLGGLDPPAEHQALADLTFALLERPDLSEGHSVVRGERSSVRACFTIVRRTDLPKARPVGKRSSTSMRMRASLGAFAPTVTSPSRERAFA